MLMQLGGNVFAASAAYFTFTLLFALGGGGGELLYMILILGLSIARSLIHRSAGTHLLYGTPGLEGGHRLSGVNRYVWLGLAQSVIVAAILAAKFHVPSTIALGVLGGLAAWPVTLAVLVRLPRFARFNQEIPVTEDKGFEGAAILMTVLGLCGLVGGAFVLVLMLDAGSAITKGPGVLLVLTVGMLVVRSFFHVQAGFSGLKHTNVDTAVERANRYANFGVISAFCGGGALLLVVMAESVSIAGMAVITAFVWMLMAWPLTVRRFFSDRQFADLLAGDNAPIHRRAPDAGLTALGWLLLAYAVFGFTFAIPTLVMGGGGDFREIRMLAAFGGSGMRSYWFQIGTLTLQAWAGFELIRMSPQHKIIATVFGVVAGAVAIYTNYPLLQQLKHLHGFLGADAIAFFPLVLSLIIPVATIVLVNRKIAPTATARFKPKTTDA
ncbi:MAG: hypothetical protein JO257_16870 [Deltaproteobacteria bacterium]|nr:hypothetical protein [Deltaproteobacteria bacterium]